MHARIVRAGIVEGKREQAIGLWEEEVAPAFRNLKGFRHGFLLTAPEKLTYVSISLWETEADAEAFETTGLYQQLVDKFEGLFVDAPTRELYELSAQVKASGKAA